MFDFRNRDKKKDDANLGGLGASLSLGNSGGFFGKASNTLRNTEEKVENFLFGHHKGNAETQTNPPKGIFGLGDTGGISLGINRGTSQLSSQLNAGSISGNLGTVSANGASLNVSLGNVPKIEIPEVSVGGSLSLPNLSGIGTEVKNDLGKVGSGIENTGKKAINFLFGEGDEKATLPEGLGLPKLGSISGNLGTVSANNTSLDISLGKGTVPNIGSPKASVGASLSLPNLSGIGTEVKNDLGKVGSGIENTGKKAINFLFGKGDKRTLHGGLSLPKLGPISGNLETVSANDTFLDISLGKGIVPNVGIPEASVGASLSLPNLSSIGKEAKNDLRKVGGTIENTGEKAINLLFGGDEKTTLPGGLSLPKLGTISGNLGTVSANDPSLDISLGKGTVPNIGIPKASVGASLSLPNLSGIGTEVKNDLGKVGSGIENTGKKAINFLFGGDEKTTLPGGLSLPKLGSISGNLGTVSANDTSLDISLGKGTVPNIGIPKASVGASLSLPNLSGIGTEVKNDLGKVGSGIENTGKKAINFLFGKGDERTTLHGGLSLPKLGSTSENLGTVSASDSSLDISLGKGIVPNVGIPKTSVGASLSLPNLSSINKEAKNDLGKVGGAIENTGEKTINLLFGGDKNATIPGGLSLPKVGSMFGNLGTVSANDTSLDISLGEGTVPNIGISKASVGASLSLPNLSGTGTEAKNVLGKVGGTIQNTGKKAINFLFGQGDEKASIPGGLDLPKVPIGNNMTEEGGQLANSPNIPAGVSVNSENTESNENSTTESQNFDKEMEKGILATYNFTTESEIILRKIEDTLRGRFDDNLPFSSSTDNTSRNEENHVTTEIESSKESTKTVNAAHSSTFDRVYNKSSITEEPTKSSTFLPIDYLGPGSKSLGGQSNPQLAPSAFDQPTGKKAPFIPVLPATTNNPMAIYNLTDGGSSQSLSSSQQSGGLSPAIYGAIGVGAIAIILIIIAFIYKAIKKATSASSGGSYSPESHHKDTLGTRESPSNSDANGRKVAELPGTVSVFPYKKPITTHSIINETLGETSLIKENVTAVTSETPDANDDVAAEIMKDIDPSNKKSNDIETSNNKLASGSQTNIQQELDPKKHSSDSKVINGKSIRKRQAPSINEQYRKVDKITTPPEKFTSDKTAASNLNEDSLRSLGQALGGLLKDQVPELKNQKETVKNQKETEGIDDDSNELISCTPPTTPTDLNDQEPFKNNQRVEHDITKNKVSITGGETEGEAFFSSGEAEIDTGSEYFSADESYVANDLNAGINSTQTVPESVIPNVSVSQEKQILTKKDVQNTEFLLEDRRKKSIEDDIADSLTDSIQKQHLNEDQAKTIMIQASARKVLVDTAVSDTHPRQRGITMCEDQLIDMEVHEILDGVEPYEAPSDDSPVEENKKSYDFLYVQESMQTNISLQTKPMFNGSEADILEETNLGNLPRNTHLQHVISHSDSSNRQSYSGMNADSVVNEIMKSSKLDSLTTQSIQKDLGTYEPNEYQKIKQEDEALNRNNHQSHHHSDYSTEKRSSLENKEPTGLIQTSENILENKILRTEDMDLNQIGNDTSQVIDHMNTGLKTEQISSTGIHGTVQRDLIDFIVPKDDLILIKKTDFSREYTSTDQQKVVPEQKNHESVIDDFKQEYQGSDQFSKEIPKWYVPFESPGQELLDPSKGNSDGLYIALSEGTVPPQVEVETERQQPNRIDQSSTQNWTYIEIDGQYDSINEQWPSHLPRNIHVNNTSGLALMKTANADNTKQGAIQEEASSNQASALYREETKSATFFEVHSVNNETELVTQQSEVKTVSVQEIMHDRIPKFELPNMDKRLMKKKKLKRRQIKSLDSGVHSYYGEYMDLVEFPELGQGQETKKNEEPTESVTSEEKNNITNTYIPSEITELEIEEDVVTILPDGTIREEKIIIDKISST